MSRSSEFIVSGAAVSAYPWIGLDHHLNPFEVTYHVVMTGAGTATVNVEGTISNIESHEIPAAIVSAHAFVLATGIVATFVSAVKEFPIAAIRLNATAVSGVANLNLITMQAGN